VRCIVLDQGYPDLADVLHVDVLCKEISVLQKYLQDLVGKRLFQKRTFPMNAFSNNVGVAIIRYLRNNTPLKSNIICVDESIEAQCCVSGKERSNPLLLVSSCAV